MGLETGEMRARSLERELADQREAFERAQGALAREREEKVQQAMQQAIEFEEREMEMKAQQKEMKAQMEMEMKALEGK